jgi:hypothetical protein
MLRGEEAFSSAIETRLGPRHARGEDAGGTEPVRGADREPLQGQFRTARPGQDGQATERQDENGCREKQGDQSCDTARSQERFPLDPKRLGRIS